MVDELNGDDKGFLSRFEASFNETRDELASLSTRYAGFERRIEQQVAEARQETKEARKEARDLNADVLTKIDQIFGKLEDQSKINYPALTIIIPAVVAALTLLGFIIHMEVTPISFLADLTSEAVKEMKTEIASLQVASAGSAAADAGSKDDRSQLNGRVGKIETENSEMRSQLAETRVKLTEIETQFCAGDAMRNLTHAHDMRIQSVLWQHDFKETFPTDNAYYPEICQRTTAGNGSRP